MLISSFQTNTKISSKIINKLKQGYIFAHTEVMTASDGVATTTLFLEATRNGRHPIGVLTSTLDKFINAGTTTEYMTQHVGTYLDDKYAKVESTSTREYYRVISPTKAVEIGDSASLAKPTGLVASSVSYDVHGRQTTEYTVKQFRTYIDGHYAHLVSSVSKVYSDPPIISATPVYDPLGKLTSRLPKILPDRPKEGTIPTSTIGSKYTEKHERRLRLDDLYLEELEKDHQNLDEDEDNIKVRSINDLKPSPVEEAEKALPTFTVKSDGELEFPTQPPPIEAENEIEPSSAHRFDPVVKKTALDSVTYIGFVDFTTTIDDTVVIFRPKKTFSTATRNIFIPKIEPTQTSDRINLFKPSVAPSISSGKPEPVEEPRRSDPTPSITPNRPNDLFNRDRPSLALNPLKSLLAASASRRNRFSKSNAAEVSSSASAASIQPSLPSGFSGRPRITLLQRPERPGGNRPDVSPEVESSAKIEPNEITSSIDPDSDVELVYKTLFTTYTYFTTFFRASSTRVKSREEVISNVVTLTNILGPSDLAKLKSSCEVDSTCQFVSSTAAPSDFTNGFIGRPNTKTSAAFINEDPKSNNINDGDDGGVFKTFFTTYTYFTTLFLDGTSSISTRTEVYSNVQSSGVIIGQTQAPEQIQSSSRAPVISSEPARNSRRLEYSSIARGSNDVLTTQESTKDEEVIIDEEFRSKDVDIVLPDENQIDIASVAPTVKTFYTTYTYFTTLFRNGTSYVTSNLETVTNTADATASPTLVQPSVTFYTTFTYWTTSIDGDNTIITSREETKTDILPATITDQILPTSVGIGIDATEEPSLGLNSSEIELDNFVTEDESTTFTPELESSELDTTTTQPLSSSSVTPSLSSSAELSSSVSADFNDLDDDFTLSEEEEQEIEDLFSEEQEEELEALEEAEELDNEVNPSSRSRLTFTRSSSTFTPVIRPNLFRTRVRPNARPRSRSKTTTVAIVTRSDVTPTLIATPVSSLLQTSSPSFVSSSLNRARSNLNSASLLSRSRLSSSAIISASSVNPSQASSSIVSSSVIDATSSSEVEESEEESEEQDENVPSIIAGLRLRRPDPFKARLKERQRQRLAQIRQESNAPSPPAFPQSPAGGAATPIFISSRTQNFRRNRLSSSSQADKSEEDSSSQDSGSKIDLPPAIASQRERARQRINALFRRRQPSFLRPAPALFNGDDKDPLEVEASEAISRRRKRQVSAIIHFF